VTTEMWDAPLDDQPEPAARPADLDAERVVVASAMSRPEIIDEMAAEFDPADITTDWLRWTWHATDEIRQTLTKGEIRWQAVHRQLAAWRASGYLPIPLPAESLLSDLYLVANPGASAWYGAKITRAAVAARLIAHGHNAILRGRSAAFDPDDDIAAIQAELDGVVRAGEQADLSTIGELLGDSLVRAVTEPTLEDRIPTGFVDLDALLAGGWGPGQLVVVGARPAMGKALALDTPLATPTGWTTMGDVRVGDYVLGADGKPTTVTFATEVQHDRECYEVEFSDKSVIVADAGHLWLTDTRASLRSAHAAATGYNRTRNQRTFPAVRTTKEILQTLRIDTKEGRLNHSIPNPKPLDLPHAELLIDPYILGLWLGDGSTDTARIATADREIVDAVRLAGYEINKIAGDNYDYGIRGLQVQLRAVGVLGNKHVPGTYLRASESQRRDLLAGLLDTDGTVRPDGIIQFAVTSRTLAEQTRELISSLGYRSTMRTKPVKGRSAASSTCYTITFTTADKVFRLSRKLARQKTVRHAGARRRFITDIRPVGSVPVRCIQVDNADHLYLAGRTMVPTHNTTLAQDFARAAAVANKIPTLIESLEMTKEELSDRILCAEARIPHHHLKQGSVTDVDMARAARRAPDIAIAPLHVNDAPILSMPMLRGQVRHLVRTIGLRLVIVDYLQLMQVAKAENRQQAIADLSRSLKLMAKEFGITVIILCQLNRGPEQRTEKKPLVSDLRESGAIEQDADIVILLHREDAYERESPRAGEADLIVGKHRGGPTATITTAFQGHYARFVDMAQT
jgi:replicative DNA helicase